MRALWLENGQFDFRDDLPSPEPRDGEALIEMALAGVCRTDLELKRGYYPFVGIPGHEFVGTVLACPSDASWVGTRVVGEINVSCGQCGYCRSGLSGHCPSRSVVGIVDRPGCFAEYVCLPLENLRAVPESIPDRRAVFAEPIAASLQVLAQVHIRPTDSVLLIGAGKLGQLLARVIRRQAPDLLVVGRYPNQIKMLAGIGARVVSEQQVPATSFDLVVEATGSSSGLELAIQTVRPRGTIVLKSTYAESPEIDLSRVVVNEIRLVGSRCGPFGPALALLESGELDPEPLVDEIFPLDRGKAAFERASEHSVLKVLIQP